MSLRVGTPRGALPTITNSKMSYSQRYEHMTKLANYGQLNETQIWKEYEKLRACLKELNEEVLHHMEKKAFNSLKQQDKAPTKDQEGTLILLDDEKKANDIRMDTYTKELNRHEERIKFLASRPNYLDELTVEGQQLQNRIKQVRKENKDLHRNAQLQGRDLINNASLLDKLVIEQQKLNRAFKTHKKYDEHMKMLIDKIQRFKEKNMQLQRAIDLRVEQFAKTENYIAEEIHYQRYEELKKQRETVGKYEAVYKRSYLSKLRELESLVNNIQKQEKILTETETNIVSVRHEIETISGLIGTQRKRFHSSLMGKKQQKMVATQEHAGEPVSPLLPQHSSNNDKNRQPQSS